MLRVSTAGLNHLLTAGAMRSQTAYAEASIQESTGLLGTSFAAYGARTQTMLNLQSSVDQAEAWSDAAGVAGDRAQAMYAAIGNVVDSLTTLRTQISAALSSSDNSGLADTGANALEELAGEINTQLGGRYLFSGARSDTAPVDLDAYDYASDTDFSDADTSYYQGDSTRASVTIDQGQTVTYGVSGDSSGFEKALRAAAMVATVTTSPATDTDRLLAAYELAQQAITELSNLQATVSVTANRLSDKQTQLAALVEVSQTALDDVKNVDTAEAALKVSTTQAQLQASFSAVSAILKVKLTDYL